MPEATQFIPHSIFVPDTFIRMQNPDRFKALGDRINQHVHTTLSKAATLTTCDPDGNRHDLIFKCINGNLQTDYFVTPFYSRQNPRGIHFPLNRWVPTSLSYWRLLNVCFLLDCLNRCPEPKLSTCHGHVSTLRCLSLPHSIFLRNEKTKDKGVAHPFQNRPQPYQT